MNEVRSLTEEGLKSVTAENWQRYIRKAIKEEDKYAELDHLDILEKCNVTIKPVVIDDVNYDSSESGWLTEEESLVESNVHQNENENDTVQEVPLDSESGSYKTKL